MRFLLSLLTTTVLLMATLSQVQTSQAQPVTRPPLIVERPGIERSDWRPRDARRANFGQRPGTPLELWSPPEVPRGGQRDTSIGEPSDSAQTPRWINPDPNQQVTEPRFVPPSRFAAPDAQAPPRQAYAPSVRMPREWPAESMRDPQGRSPSQAYDAMQRDPRYNGPIDALSDLPAGQRLEVIRQRARAATGRDGTNDAMQRICQYPGTCPRDWDRGMESVRSPDGPVTVGRVRCATVGCGAAAEGVQGPGYFGVGDNGGRPVNDMRPRNSVGNPPDRDAVQRARAGAMGNLADRVDERSR